MGFIIKTKMIVEILNQLASETSCVLAQTQRKRAIVGSKLGSSSVATLSPVLKPFQVGALGNFPYYWQNPSNLKFNHLTYNWISANLKANAAPAQLDGSFNNYFIEALSAVSYGLSSADQKALNAAQQNIANQQLALLQAWVAAYGSLPPAAPPQQPIDAIINIITTTWASPPTTLSAMQTSTDLSALLNNTPASGAPILPTLTAYLSALNSSVSLQNAVSMNTGYLMQSLSAVQSPSPANGGLATDDGNYNPAYTISPSVADIIASLQNPSNKVTLNTSVTNAQNGYNIAVGSGAPFSAAPSDFFSLKRETNADYFQSLVAASSNPIQVDMTFTGVTMVNYGPAAYNMSAKTNWFWTKPITDAIANGTANVSGFKFSPNPEINFTSSGPFGYLTTVGISNYPTINITLTNSDYQNAAKAFEETNSFNVSLLSVPVGTYSQSKTVDSSSVTVSLMPPPFTAPSTSSLAWVLGVLTNYPAA